MVCGRANVTLAVNELVDRGDSAAIEREDEPYASWQHLGIAHGAVSQRNEETFERSEALADGVVHSFVESVAVAVELDSFRFRPGERAGRVSVASGTEDDSIRTLLQHCVSVRR